MKRTVIALLPLIFVACFTDSSGEGTEQSEHAVTAPGCNPCDLVLCAPEHSCDVDCDGQAVCNPDVCEGAGGLSCNPDFNCKFPGDPADGGFCSLDCEEPDPCGLVLCAEGHTCELGCDGQAVCNPVVCDGLGGLSCHPDFNCKIPGAMEDGGFCSIDCVD